MTEEFSADSISTAQIFEQMPQFLNRDKAAGTNATIQFDLSGDQGGKWWVKIADSEATSGEGDAENPNLTLLADADDYKKITLGQMDGTAAFMQGKLKIKGDMGLAIKMQTLFNRPA